MRKAIDLPALILAIAGPVLAAPATVQVVKSPAILPQPFAGIAREGDIFVSDGRFAAVIAATARPLWSAINYGHPDVAGCVAAFLPAGASARPEAQLGYPSFRLDGSSLPVTTSSVKPEGNAVVVRASAQGPDGVRLDILVRYTFVFETGRIDVAAEVRNAGKTELKGLSASLGATAWQSYNFSPYNSKSFPSLNFRVYERPDHGLAWHNPNPVETSEKPLPGSLRPGQVHRLTYSILTAAALSDLLDRLYRIVRVQAVRAGLEIKKYDGPAEVIVREPATGAVFFRTVFDKPLPLVFPLPAGTYEVQANLFPAVVQKTFIASAGKDAAASAWAPEAPALGRVRVSVADRRGRHVPGKVSFIGLAPTRSPYFLPENPIVTARSWETLKNAVTPPADGAEVAHLPDPLLERADQLVERPLEAVDLEDVPGHLEEVMALDRHGHGFGEHRRPGGQTAEEELPVRPRVARERLDQQREDERPQLGEPDPTARRPVDLEVPEQAEAPLEVSVRPVDLGEDSLVPASSFVMSMRGTKLSLKSCVLLPVESSVSRPSARSRRPSRVLGRAVSRPTMAVGIAASWMKPICRSKMSSGSLSRPH